MVIVVVFVVVIFVVVVDVMVVVVVVGVGVGVVVVVLLDSMLIPWKIKKKKEYLKQEQATVTRSEAIST
jgi:cell division protein FtsW (lipid II flippase)